MVYHCFGILSFKSSCVINSVICYIKAIEIVLQQCTVSERPPDLDEVFMY